MPPPILLVAPDQATERLLLRVARSVFQGTSANPTVFTTTMSLLHSGGINGAIYRRTHFSQTENDIAALDSTRIVLFTKRVTDNETI
jgi:hypothetical protein